MKLVKKSVTSKQVAANNGNSEQSTGPRTQAGKARSGKNALKHGIFARVDMCSIQELGEDRLQYFDLRDSLYEGLAPRDRFEQLLVDDMVRIRWRLQRVLRAEAASVAAQQQQFEFIRKWQAVTDGLGKEAAEDDEHGESSSKDGLCASPSNCETIVLLLKYALGQITTTGLDESLTKTFERIYGRTPGPLGMFITGFYRFLLKQHAEAEQTADEAEAPDNAAGATDAKMNMGTFLELLNGEIAILGKGAKLYAEHEKSLAGPMRDSLLLPSLEQTEKTLRYNTTLENLFERKLQLLIALRRERERGKG